MCWYEEAPSVGNGTIPPQLLFGHRRHSLGSRSGLEQSVHAQVKLYVSSRVFWRSNFGGVVSMYAVNTCERGELTGGTLKCE